MSCLLPPFPSRVLYIMGPLPQYSLLPGSSSCVDALLCLAAALPGLSLLELGVERGLWASSPPSVRHMLLPLLSPPPQPSGLGPHGKQGPGWRPAPSPVHLHDSAPFGPHVCLRRPPSSSSLIVQFVGHEAKVRFIPKVVKRYGAWDWMVSFSLQHSRGDSVYFCELLNLLLQGTHCKYISE